MILMLASIHMDNRRIVKVGTTCMVFDCVVKGYNRKKTIVMINIVNLVRYRMS